MNMNATLNPVQMSTAHMVVCDYFKTSTDDLKVNRRGPGDNYRTVKQILVMLLRDNENTPVDDIRQILNYKGHREIYTLYNEAKNAFKNDVAFRKMYTLLKQTIYGREEINIGNNR